MGELKEIPRFSVDQYLAMERASNDRHEFVDGFIYDMAGESGEHADISANIVIALGSQLKGTPCRVRMKDSKVRSGPRSRSRRSTSGMFSYPDVFVVCGEPEYFDDHGDVLLNPKVVIEVLSPSTESFDRGDKGERFRTWNPTLTDYLDVSQDEPRIERFTRTTDVEWAHEEITGLDAVVVLKSIRCELSMRDVYDRVVFAERESS